VTCKELLVIVTGLAQAALLVNSQEITSDVIRPDKVIAEAVLPITLRFFPMKRGLFPPPEISAVKVADSSAQIGWLINRDRYCRC